MRQVAFAGLLAGLAFTIFLVVHFGAGAVAASLRAAGFGGLAAVCFLHLGASAMMGIAWWLLVAPGRGGANQPWVFLWGRLVRDAGSEVLPFSQVGGYVLGARAVILQGVTAALAAASTVVDVTLELCGQIAFTALGIGLMLWLRLNTTLLEPVLLGIALAIAIVAAFVTVQRRGADLLDRLTARVAQRWLDAIAAGAEAVQGAIREIHGRSTGLWAGFLLHLLAWMWAAAEAWVALHFMGAPLSLGAVLAIESLLYAVRSVAFIVPSALGVQEVAYVLLGATFGLTPDIALGLSLLKRGRDLVLGVPALLVWQLAESRRLWRRRLDEKRG